MGWKGLDPAPSGVPEGQGKRQGPVPGTKQPGV